MNGRNHLSLYKQGPEWPRVAMSFSHFPPKNVTSCYSEGKNVVFSSVLFFYVFYLFYNHTFSLSFSFFFSYPFFILSYSTVIQDNALVLLFSKCWTGMRESITLLLFWSKNRKVVAWFARWFLSLRKTQRLKVFSWV